MRLNLAHPTKFTLGAKSPFEGERPDDHHEDGGSNEGNRDTSQESDRRVWHQHGEQPSPDERADQTHDDVANDPKTTAGHQLASQPSRDGAHDQPREQSTWCEYQCFNLSKGVSTPCRALRSRALDAASPVESPGLN